MIVGATIEYYTKLSHFSIGVDGDGQMVVPNALGLMAVGYLKYTF